MHPILRSKVFRYGYLSIWIFVLTLNLVLNIYYVAGISFVELAVKSGVFCTVFALLGLPLWYNVSSFKPEKNYISLVFHHLAVAAAMILIWFFTSSFIVGILYPVDQLSVDLTNHMNPLLLLIGMAGYIIITMSYYLYISYNSLQDKHKTEMALHRSLAEVEVNMLRTQINPHFLFNSLNSISALTMLDADKAQEMVIKLSEYLRYTVANVNSPFVALSLELENVHRYLDIEKVRFGAKLGFSFEVDSEALDRLIPSMILQPLFENAIKYGVYESVEPVEISTTVKADSESFRVVIRNSYSSGVSMTKGAGIGLANITQRLGLIFNNEKLVQVNKDEPGIFEVSLLIPNNSNDK